MVNILIVGVDEDIRVSDGVSAFFVRPWVQGRHVDVLNLFVWIDHVMQLDGVCATAEESVPGLEWVDDFWRVEKLT